MASTGRLVAFVDTAGNIQSVRDTRPWPDKIPIQGWRAAARAGDMEARWYGITNAGLLAYASDAGDVIPPPALTRWADLGTVPVLAITTDSIMPTVCLVTAGGYGRCIWDHSSVPLESEKVHAVCLAAANAACFLDVFGDVHCIDKFMVVWITFPALDGEPWVEIACGSSTLCARALSGKLRCFSIPILPEWEFKLPAELPGNYTMVAAYHTPYASYQNQWTDRQRVCGIDTARRLQCMFAWRADSAEYYKLVTLEPERTWAAVAVMYDGFCAISAD